MVDSAQGRRWRLRQVPLEGVQDLAAAHGLPELVARLLTAKDVAKDAVPGFLAPTLRDLMPDPDSLLDMDKAAARIADGVERREKICVFADYDVDGATSAAVMLRTLRALGADPMLYVPDRIDEGYGPNADAMAALAADGVDLVITLDCGTTAHGALEAARDAGLSLVVVDHHMAEGTLPPAAAIVNPNRPGDGSGLGHLAAVGVTFLTCVALLRTLRERGSLAGKGPNLLDWLDLVALGTVCDVVPLTGLNRAFVVQGLKVMARSADPASLDKPFPGLAALARVAGLSETPGAYHLGFILGPRLNAGGRVGRADLGARLLSLTDGDEGLMLAQDLDGLNQERRAIEAEVLDTAMVEAERALDAWPERPVLLVSGEGWHPGVIGIVASRLKDRFNRPALVLGVNGDQAKGSGRSISGVDLGAAVLAAREAGLLVNGGGHTMAAGLTVARDSIADLDAFLCRVLGHDVDVARMDQDLWVDATVSLQGASRTLLDTMAATGPFGAGAPEPVIAIRDVVLDWVQEVGESHLRLALTSPSGARLTAMAFRARGTDLGVFLEASRGGVIHVCGTLRADNYKGRNGVQLHLKDAAPVSGQPVDFPRTAAIY